MKHFSISLNELNKYQIPKKPKIISFGCGNAREEIAALKIKFSHGFTYMGIDPNPNMMRENVVLVKENERISFLVCRGENYFEVARSGKISPGSFDLAIFRRPDFHHYKKAFDAMVKYSAPYFLKPGGTVILTFMGASEDYLTKGALDILLQYDAIKTKDHVTDKLGQDAHVVTMTNRFSYNPVKSSKYLFNFKTANKSMVKKCIFKLGGHISQEGRKYVIATINANYANRFKDLLNLYGCVVRVRDNIIPSKTNILAKVGIFLGPDDMCNAALVNESWNQDIQPTIEAKTV